MFRNEKTDSDSNFWISYADLMAGLLFVFILLIGAIVSKSSLLKIKLHDKEDTLVKTQALVSEQDAYILQKDKLLAKRNAALEKEKKHLSKIEHELQRKNARLAKDELLLSKNERLLKLKLTEIKKLNKLLLVANAKTDKLNGKIVIVQTLLDKKENILKKTSEALEKEQEALKAYEGKVLVLSNELSDVKDTVKIKDEKLLTLLTNIDEKKTKYDDLVAKLQEQKAKIKSLTGIKLKVVTALKEALGSKINIDKKTGSLKLASNILFAVGKSTLKDEAKVELKKAFEEYIGTLITNKEIKPHLEKIIIEGHTDSDGGYIYNLKLSQDRALSVMQYLLTLDFSKNHNIKPLMIASGRAYLDAIAQKGVEDKEASRRIEIKFRLKNDDAMHEIEKVLDAK
jgi:chemotaxis protein MotB